METNEGALIQADERPITSWTLADIAKVETSIREGRIPTSLHEYNLLMDAVATLRLRTRAEGRT